MRRRDNKTVKYLNLIGYECANPKCKSGFNIEGHHIVPLSKGGENKYWNIVGLCLACHRKLEKKSTKRELYTMKCMKELMKLGFVLDEQEKDFNANIKTI